ncbi:MAG: tetratricopeptide repeat protein [Clostridia bacterium]|nr:tetratricopeptide repeat protein [Clostridia bacterium]
MSISVDRVLGKLDEYFSKNDCQSAEKHILFWLDEAENEKDNRTKLLLKNELMGLYRKLSRRDEALATVSSALALVNKMGIENDIGAGTTYLNSATVYKAFDMAEKALPVFEKAQKIYESSLAENDKRLAGLYNNMALALVDLKRFSEAENLYNKAISIMRQNLNGELEIAITYLNIATLKENELGEVEAESIINEYLEKSTKILDSYQNRDGYYAFVCEKCASVYGYYGHFFYENELNKRARSIYEGA